MLLKMPIEFFCLICFIISKGRWTSIEVINISMEGFFQGLQNGQLKLEIGIYFKKLWIIKLSYWSFKANIALVKRTMHTFVILQMVDDIDFGISI